MIHIGTGLLLIILGYLIKEKKMVWMIAGYNTSSKKKKAEYDTEALANGMGKFLYGLGGIVMVGSIGKIFDYPMIMSISWSIFVFYMIIFLIYANTGNRYKKEE